MSPPRCRPAVPLLARAAGLAGMAGGQAIDLASVGRGADEAQLRQMHRLKTGALLQGQRDDGRGLWRARPGTGDARDYGAAIGLAFQVVDDILDVTADSATLGKTAGKDAATTSPPMCRCWGWSARAQARAAAGAGARACAGPG
jgi:farnesyl diphosphate synthase